MKHKINLKTAMFFLQRKVKSYSVREFISKSQGKFIGKKQIVGISKLVSDSENLHIENLKKNGYTEFGGTIGEIVLSRIVKNVSNLNMFDPFNKALGDFKFENINSETHVANFKRKDLVALDDVLDIANDPGILRIVQEFLGATPTISNINMWWSIAGKSKAKDAQLFHRDVDDLKFCKLFIYLTDVSYGDGPHTYVKGSSSTNKLTKIRRYEDSEVESVFGKENVINFCRPKGSFFIVDTYGFHKGTLPIENDRLLLQVQYSLNPIGIENYNPELRNNNEYDSYINRLIIK